ncbi:hypothetical protein ACGF13_35910 [Kitasatospora sp. NPDC048286]|uniref:hypothetical protein n=1 Tax=Kitasatospora sp. NPDC048286 TaxID=3364047 RepID=UPI003721F5A3
MPDAGPLVVPLQVDALVINDDIRQSEDFQRWLPDFDKLNRRLSPEPAPFEDLDDVPGDPELDGVLVHWRLPEALARGDQDPATGRTVFPLVPNRWLVVRYRGTGATRAAAGWVVHSDFLEADYPDTQWSGSSPFLVPPDRPGGDRPTGTWAGRKHDLDPVADGPWQEPDPRPLFLTAIGPGLPAFAAYQPYNEDVFSLHDPLGGVLDTDTLSYQVIGWYSDPAQDILAGESEFDTLLAALGWSAPDGSQPARRSLYAGTALAVQWERQHLPLWPAKPLGQDVKVAVGHNTADAYAALTAARTGSPETGRLLSALHAGLLTITGDDSYDASLAVLLGRPLALLRARLTLELSGPPVTDPSWATVLDPPAPDFADYRWNVRLGDPDRHDDGLIGYFDAPADATDPTATDYTRLRTAFGPGTPAGGYPTPIGTADDLRLTARPAGDPQARSAYVTLLADPWSAVHATTDILPTVRTRLPAEQVSAALARVKAAFRLSPLLAPVRRTQEQTQEQAQTNADGVIVMPRPGVWKGTWSWSEPRAGTDGSAGPDWADLPITPAGPAAVLSDPQPEARTGFLLLADALTGHDQAGTTP